MKTKLRMTFLFVLVTMMAAGLTAQTPADLAGTWVGMATLEIEEEPNELTLVLEVKDGKLAGKMTDQYGTLNDIPIEGVSLEEGVFSFTVSVAVPSGTFKLEFKMNVSSDSMTGKLYAPDYGASGTWEAKKQK